MMALIAVGVLLLSVVFWGTAAWLIYTDHNGPGINFCLQSAQFLALIGIAAVLIANGYQDGEQRTMLDKTILSVRESMERKLDAIRFK